MSLIIRSTLFNLLFYIITALFVVGGSPLLFGPRSWAMAGLRTHALTCLWLLKHVVGLHLEVRGKANIPDCAYLAASKHQSAWETFALIPLFRDPAMVMKAELFWIPFHGWFSRKFEMIGVKRETGPSALRHLVREAKDKAAQGREIVIFPEGTRRAPKAPPDYKSGISMIYHALDVPCVPIALNSGLFWPRRSWLRKPGTIVVEFLPAIPPGMDRKQFKKTLQNSIETATDNLLEETLNANNAALSH